MTQSTPELLPTQVEPFKREERFIVIKRKGLVGDQEERIRALLSDELGVMTSECVVVESDWPEYETVWRMIEARVTGRIEHSTPDRKAVDEMWTEGSHAHYRPDGPLGRVDWVCIEGPPGENGCVSVWSPSKGQFGADPKKLTVIRRYAPVTALTTTPEPKP